MSEFPTGSEEISQASCIEFRDAILAFSGKFYEEYVDLTDDIDRQLGLGARHNIHKSAVFQFGELEITLEAKEGFADDVLVEETFSLLVSEFVEVGEGKLVLSVKEYAVSQEADSGAFEPFYEEKLYESGPDGRYTKKIRTPAEEKYAGIMFDEDNNPTPNVIGYVRELHKEHEFKKMLGEHGFTNTRYIEAMQIIDALKED